jgi:N-methylhydantoinase A
MLGGRMQIEPRLAEEAIQRKVGDALGLDPVRAAYGIIRICVANMVGEIRAITAERGVDPAGYALLAGGGAGPLHAALIARELGIGSIIVPSYPGLLSAGGLIVSDLRIDRLRSFRCRVERDGTEELIVALDGLVDDVTRALSAEGYTDEPLVEVALDMKYAGQNWEIAVPLDRRDLAPERVIAAFDRLHEELYGFAIPGHPHEVLSLRATAIGPMAESHELSARRFPRGSSASATTPEAREVRSVWDEVAGDFAPAAVFVRDDLGPGATLRGPCLVEGMDAVVWIPSDCVGAVRESGALVVSFEAVPAESRSQLDV